MQTAWGRISAKRRMAVTEMRMAATGLSRRSRNIGRASNAAALMSKRETRSQCGLLMSCETREGRFVVSQGGWWLVWRWPALDMFN